MNVSENKKKCGACGELFDCHANDIANCHCSKQQVDADQVFALKQKFNDCLCPDCLEEFTSSISIQSESASPKVD